MVTLSANTRRILLAIIVVLLCVAGGIALALTTRAQSSTPVTNTVSAGPLLAHYEQVGGRQVAICDATVANVSNDGREGVAGRVDIQGPATVTITVVGNGRTRRAVQQLTKNNNSVTFDFPLTAPADSVTILAKNIYGSGSCQISPPAYLTARVNKLDGLVG